MNFCSVENCKNPVRLRGMCNAHYLRMKRNGTTDRDPTWVQNNHCRKQCPATKKLAGHLDYVQHSLWNMVRASERYHEHREERQAYAKREDVLAKSRTRAITWRKDNKERKKLMDKKFYNENRARVNSYKAKRRAVVLKARPAWLTAEMDETMRAMYAEAKRLSAKTGIAHEVDHIVPLQGKTVCGLHVPWNLRVITEDQNNRRPRIWAIVPLAGDSGRVPTMAGPPLPGLPA